MIFTTHFDSPALWQICLSDPASITIEGILIFNKHLLFLLILLVLVSAALLTLSSLINEAWKPIVVHTKKKRKGKAKPVLDNEQNNSNQANTPYLLKIFYNKKLFKDEGVSPNSLQAILVPNENSVKEDELWDVTALNAGSCELHTKWPLDMGSLIYNGIFFAGGRGRVLKDIPKQFYRIEETLDMRNVNLNEGIPVLVKATTIVPQCFLEG